MTGLVPIERYLRIGEPLDLSDDLVVRGWPLTIEGLLRNADATRRRYSRAGEPFTAISAEVTVEGWDLGTILTRPRLETRRSFASAPVGTLLEAGFDLLATFRVPHYSVQLPAYTESATQHLLRVLGDIRPNPHHVRREQR